MNQTNKIEVTSPLGILCLLEKLSAGTYTRRWKAARMASGIYFILQQPIGTYLSAGMF